MHDIQELYKHYLNGECNREELHTLLLHFRDHEPNPSLVNQIEEVLRETEPAWQDPPHIETLLHENHQRIKQHIHAGTRKKVRFLPTWTRYAAAILLFLSVSIGIYWYNQNNTPQPQLTSQYGDDALPGTNRATLTLADGRRIVLSEEQEGIVIHADELTYTDGTPLAQNTVEYATLTTPNGGQYQITLPDGSKVWLNAGSSLKYPTQFTEAERKVELTGEGYFEVTRNEKQPFIVESNGQRVEVLGTAFNINTYTNQPYIVTTLVEGTVQVRNSLSGQALIINPSEQTIVRGTDISSQVVRANAFVAWKNGDFVFEATPLDEVLRQIERWYDIEVDTHTIPERKLHAALSRDTKLSTLLYSIEKVSGLKFRLKERRLVLQEQ